MGNRRQYSAEFKAKIVLQALTGEKNGSELCRTHKLNPNLLSCLGLMDTSPCFFDSKGVSTFSRQGHPGNISTIPLLDIVNCHAQRLKHHLKTGIGRTGQRHQLGLFFENESINCRIHHPHHINHHGTA
jgi:hypothetical protein